MGKFSRVLMIGITGLTGAAFSQIITFNGPTPWVTQRNDSIIVRAQIDTAQVKKKEFALSVDLVNDRGQKKPLVKKAFPIKDYTEEFPVGTVKQFLVGGRSYIRIGWSISGTESKGTIGPIGIIALDKIPAQEMIPAAHAQDGADAAGIISSVKEADFRSAGAAKFAFSWNKKALFIVLVKPKAPVQVRFAFDGKNGKNAFLSFADRIAMYSSVNDSVRGSHFSHQMAGDTLKYSEKPWQNEISKTVAGDRVAIRIPWYDLGVVPFDGRKLGIGITTSDEKGNPTAALPKGADFFNPGTWCGLQLAK